MMLLGSRNARIHSRISVLECFRLAFSTISILSILAPPAIILESPAPANRAVASPLRSYGRESAPLAPLEPTGADLVDFISFGLELEPTEDCQNRSRLAIDPECQHTYAMHENSWIVNVSLCPESILSCVSAPNHLPLVSLVAVRRVWNHGRSLSDIIPRTSAPTTPIVALALLLGGDIEINPGPTTPGASPSLCPVCDKTIGKRAKSLECEGCDRRIHFMCQAAKDPEPGSRQRAQSYGMCPGCVDCMQRFPCMVCHKGVTWAGRKSLAMQCEQCDRYMHIDCAEIGDDTYRGLADSSNLWLCSECGLPNHSDLIQSYNVSVHNTFDILNEDCSLDEYTDLDSTIRTDTSLIEPQSASTPVSHHPSGSGRKLARNLKIVSINFRSIVKNRDRLGVFLKCVDPDIILGSETHLIEGIATPTELSGYSVQRRDRDTRDGGVLIAAKKDLLLIREYELETDCEDMFCKINIAGSKTLHLGAFYRPDVSDTTSLSRLSDSLSRIPKSHCLVLGGDFNLPGFRWFDFGPQLKSSVSNPGEHERLVELMFDHGITQHIHDVTRVDPFHGTENTLDLLFSNRPGSVISARVVPGISDHDVPLIEMDLKPIRVTKKPHEVPQYKSADWEGFSDYITEELNKASPDLTINAPPDTDVNLMWNKLRDILTDGIRKFIPHRKTRARLDLPYITSDIRKLIRRRDRLYNQMVKARQMLQIMVAQLHSKCATKP